MNSTTKKFRVTQRTNFTRSPDKFLDENIRGVMGTTWDANHLTSFLNKSFYSNKKSSQKQYQNQQKKYTRTFCLKRKSRDGDFFFKNLRYDMNKSSIGYTDVNPLITNIEVSNDRKQALLNYFISKYQKLQNEQKSPKNKITKLMCDSNNKFRFQANAVKFRASDPLTSRYQPEKEEKVGFSLQRMRNQINKRYPHGIIGIDNPQNTQSTFYQPKKSKTYRIRQNPLSSTSYQLDREWKSKKRISPLKEEKQFRNTECVRKFRNQNIHGYNILTNRKVIQ